MVVRQRNQETKAYKDAARAQKHNDDLRRQEQNRLNRESQQ